MPSICVRVSERLHERLIERGRQLGIDSLSDSVRILLLSALENQDLGSNNALLHQATNYAVMVHCLVEESLLSLVESGSELRDKAHERAEKLIAHLVEKSSQ